MATFAELKARGARKIYWLELDGIRWAFGDGAITNANRGTLFTDALTPTFDFSVAAMQAPRRVDSRSIKVLSGAGKTGGFEVELVDLTMTSVVDGYSPATTVSTPDGFLTWMFGSERTTIGRAPLTADVTKQASGAAAWAVLQGTLPYGGATPLYFYCELETISGLHDAGTPNGITAVTRSVWHSHATAHRALGSGASAIFPAVTDHPTVWQGRGGTLFVTFMDENGSLAGTPATARSVAHKTRGVLKGFHEAEGVYVLTFAGIDTLLDRQIMRGGARAKVSQKIVVENTIVGATDALTMTAFQEDIGGANPEEFRIRIAMGTYSADRFVELVNESLSGALSIDAAAFSGQLQLTLESNRLGIHYRTDSITAKPVAVYLSGSSMLGNVLTDSADETTYWISMGVNPPADDRGQIGHALPVLVTDDGDPGVSENFDSYLMRRPSMIIDGSINPTIALGSDADDSPIADFVTPPDGDYMILRSQAGDQLFSVFSIDTGTRLVKLTSVSGPDGDTETADIGPTLPLQHEGTFESPIWAIRPYYGMPGEGINRTGACGETTLCLLLSTGVAAYNADAIYDSLPEGVGIEFPHETPAAGASSSESWIDVESFERFFGEVQPYIFRVVDLIIDPTPMRKWLTDRIAFLGGYLVVENGQLKVRKGLGPLQHEGLTVTSDMIRTKGTRGVERTFSVTAGGVKHSWNYDWVRKVFLRTWTSLMGNLTSTLKDNIFHFEDRGIHMMDDLAIRLGNQILGDFGLENPIYTDSFDGSMIDLEAGQSISYSDEGASSATDDTRRYIGRPNLQGTRGHSSTRMMTLTAKYSHAKDACDVTLMQVRRKKGGFAPSANIASYVEGGGQTTLTCQANVYGATSDGVDASWFAAGDLVRVVRCNPTLAGVADPGSQNQFSGFTIVSVSGNTIVLNATISGVFGASPQFLGLIYDEYVSGQRAGAKDFCHVSDGGDINATADDPYDWG